MPCYHEACEDCFKEQILSEPLAYPCPKCKKDPVNGTQELDECLVNNLFDDPQGQFFPEDAVFLRKYTEVRKLALEQHESDIQKFGESKL